MASTTRRLLPADDAFGELAKPGLIGGAWAPAERTQQSGRGRSKNARGPGVVGMASLPLSARPRRAFLRFGQALGLEIGGLQHDRLAVRGAVGGVVPGGS